MRRWTVADSASGKHSKNGNKLEEGGIWQVSFMSYDIGYFDLEACRVEPVENPFGPKVLTMSPV